MHEQLKVLMAGAGAASATTDVSGSTIDMAGYEGVIFTARIATANAGNFLRGEHSDDGTNWEEIEGSKVVAAEDAQSVVLEIHKPKKRYVRAAIERTAASVTGDIVAVLYGARKAPVESGDVRVFLSMPSSGTP